MEITNNNQNSPQISYLRVGEQTTSKTFVANVFLLMFIALGVSAFFAWQFASNASLQSYLISPTSGVPGLGKVAIFGPSWFVLIMAFGFRRLSATSMIAVFIIFSIINGISFSFILLA